MELRKTLTTKQTKYLKVEYVTQLHVFRDVMFIKNSEEKRRPDW
jgi:hypothetical protein